MKRITNREMGGYVAARLPFRNSKCSCFEKWVTEDRYVVCSYGPHFPMYVWDEGRWFENADKYSRTTSAHMTYARPGGPTTKLSTNRMKTLVGHGYVAMVAWRLEGDR